MKGIFKNIASSFLEIDTTDKYLFLSIQLQMLYQNNNEAMRDKSNVSYSLQSLRQVQVYNSVIFTC